MHAAAFTVMLATGAILYAPPLSRVFADRPLIKGIHLFVAVALGDRARARRPLGDRRALGRTRAGSSSASTTTTSCSCAASPRPARFNGGQKLHAAIQAGLLVLVYVSGVLLWLGERNTDFRFAGTIAMHDFCTLLGLVLLLGHIWKTRSTPGSMGAITRGTVSADFAVRHHPRWQGTVAAVNGPARVSLGALVAAGAVSAVGFAAALVLDLDQALLAQPGLRARHALVETDRGDQPSRSRAVRIP